MGQPDDGEVRLRAYESDRERINERRRGNERQPDVVHRLLTRFDQSTLERFDTLRENATGDELPSQDADAFLNALMDVWEHADADVVDALNYSTRSTDPLTKDEVQAALRMALREELPSGVFRQ